jgi:uncharacterized protein YecT (DUF1311 family)
MRASIVVVAMSAAMVAAISTAASQSPKPSAAETKAIRACVAKYAGHEREIERRCLYELVAKPCQNSPEGQSNLGMADCHRREEAVWDSLLNDTFKALRDELDDDEQKSRLRDMQRAWIADRDATCGFYHHKIRGSMAVPMAAACLTRETMRRVLVLEAFRGL